MERLNEWFPQMKRKMLVCKIRILLSDNNNWFWVGAFEKGLLMKEHWLHEEFRLGHLYTFYPDFVNNINKDGKSIWGGVEEIILKNNVQTHHLKLNKFTKNLGVPQFYLANTIK